MTRVLESWFYQLMDEAVSQASTIKQMWDDTSWRDAYLMAIDNVVDDREVITEGIPEPYSRDDIYWELRSELDVESVVW